MNILKTSEILNKRNIRLAIIIIFISIGIGLFYNWLIPNSLSLIYHPMKVKKIDNSFLFGNRDSVDKISQISNQSKSSILIDTLSKTRMVNPKDTLRKKPSATDKITELKVNSKDKVTSFEPNDLKTVTYNQMLIIITSDDFIIIDARQPEQYQKGHIPKAINIFALDSPDIKVPKILDLPRDKKIIVYCDGGNCDLSHELSKDLIESFGFKKVYLYEAGWEEWSKLYKK